MPHGITGHRHARTLVVIAAVAACAAATPARAAVALQSPIEQGATVALPAIGATGVSVLGPSTARVHATVDTRNAATTVYLRYGEGSLLNMRTPTITLGGSARPSELLEDLLDLQPGTSYKVQLVAETPAGVITSSSVPFTTPLAVFVNPATGVLTSSAANKRTRCTIVGTAKADRLVGTKKRDVICGLGGNDRIAGRGGGDLILAGAGSDRATGGSGADRVHGNSGNDRLYGNTGRDRLYGNAGRDLLNAASNRRRGDLVNGGKGRDRATVNRGDRVRSVERFRRR